MNLKALIFISIFSSSSFLLADTDSSFSQQDINSKIDRIISEFHKVDLYLCDLQAQIIALEEKISRLDERMDSAEMYIKNKQQVTDFYNDETSVAIEKTSDKSKLAKTELVAKKIRNKSKQKQVDLCEDPLINDIITKQPNLSITKTHRNFQEHKFSAEWFYFRTKLIKYAMRHKQFQIRREHCVDRILPNVYVGDLKAIKYCLEKNLVDHIVSFNSTGKLLVPAKYDATVLTLRSQDNDTTKLKEIYRKCLPLLRTYKKGLLIHCTRGHSRSASLCILAIMKHYDVPYQTAFRYVKFKRPTICPNPCFVEQLIKIENHT